MLKLDAAAATLEAKAIERIGADIRHLRTSLQLSQQTVSDIFGWNRDAMSKVENGVTHLPLVNYLRIMDMLKEADPQHPAHALVRRYLRPTKSR